MILLLTVLQTQPLLCYAKAGIQTKEILSWRGSGKERERGIGKRRRMATAERARENAHERQIGARKAEEEENQLKK